MLSNRRHFFDKPHSPVASMSNKNGSDAGEVDNLQEMWLAYNQHLYEQWRYAAMGQFCRPQMPRRFDSQEALQRQPGDSLTGKVWAFAQHAHGCRLLQDVLESADSTEVVAVGHELKGFVWRALECKNANHVLQKYIVVSNPRDSQFIIDEIFAHHGGQGYWYAARHCFGCRVLERLLEHCSQDQVEELVKNILNDVVGLCKHQYGNYVAQHILEHGADAHQLAAITAIVNNIQTMCTDYHGVAVVKQALCTAPPSSRSRVGKAILKNQELLVSMARSRHGQEAVKHLLKSPDCEVRESSRQILTEHVEELKLSRYGRVIVNFLQQAMQDV